MTKQELREFVERVSEEETLKLFAQVIVETYSPEETQKLVQLIIQYNEIDF